MGARLWESNEREFSRGYTFFLLFAFHAAQYYKLSSIQSYLQKTRRTQAQEGRGREGGREGGSGCVGVEREKERGVERREIRDEEIIKERRRCDDKRSTQARKATIVSLAASE